MYYFRRPVFFVVAAAPLNDLAMALAPRWDDTRVVHMWNAVPANWESLGHPPAGTTIDLHIVLEPHRENALIDALYEVSDPAHPKYGAHLSKEQVAKLVAPHPDTLGLVYSWLEHSRVPSSSISTTHGGSWLTVTGVPVSHANDLLGASYQLYRHTGTNVTVLRTVGYALPAALHAHVQTVAPTTYFSSGRALQQTPRKRFREEAVAKPKETSGGLVTVLSKRDQPEEVKPAFLRWLYKTETYVPVATDRNVLGVPGYMDEVPSQQDLTTFMRAYQTNAEDATFTVIPVNGGKYDPSSPGTREANMNIQYAEGMTYPTPHVFYSIGGRNSWFSVSGNPTSVDSDFVWINYLLSLKDIPQTITISYGDSERNLPRRYATTMCFMFARLGLRGTSVLVASGNDGVGEGACKNDSGEDQFTPDFPSSCPWVTSVGGTTSREPEIAASLSGGGFSLYFPRPKYQAGLVTAFLGQLGEQHKGWYNPANRGIPDVAAQALNFQIVDGGRVVRGDGTSCSTPTMASIISLLNDHLLASGKKSLGFLNIWLYREGLPGLNDIVTGSNPGCNTEGFSAVAGWDPVTGLGTPNFVRLQQTLANRPVVSSIPATHSPTPPIPTLQTGVQSPS